MRRLGMLCLAALLWSLPVRAQPERYDAGRRLIAFEQAWDQQRDAEARKRAIPLMKNALNNFFANKYGEAARCLDAARESLTSSEPPADNVAWACSVSFQPERRIVEQTDSEIRLCFRHLYDPKGAPPGRIGAQVTLVGEKNARLRFEEADSRMWQEGSYPFNLQGVVEGDHRVEVTLTSGETTLSKFGCQFSMVKNRDERLAALSAAVKNLPTERLTTEQRTLKAHVEVLRQLAKRVTLETDYPAHRLLVEAEQLAALPVESKYFDSSRVGQFWMTLSTNKGEAPIRMYVPPQAKDGKPLPLVIAMHGAGGTENMFFDAYGHGEVVRQCEKRGWLLVAPRANFVGHAPVAAIIDELSKRYPVDVKRIFLVGHSMGAGQAMALAQQLPERWAGVAALGGTGPVSKAEAFQQVPLFVGCGTEDFALPGARSVTKKLAAAEAKNFVSKEYSDIEHILIVQVALGDVFKWYETLPSR